MKIDENIVLSILIPTYNRANYLEKALNKFFLQIDESLSKKIEILVSDNCSTDKTYSILEKYKNNFKIRYEYWKNDENIGADGNFLKLIEKSKGKFCWIFGDDEYLTEKSLKVILNAMEANENIGLIHLNNSSSKFSINKIVNSNEMIKIVNCNISFITANIFNKKYIDTTMNYKKYIGCSLIQEYFYLQAILKSEENYILNGNFFKTDRAENIGGYRLFNVFGEQQNKIFDFFKYYGLEQKTIDYINVEMLKNFFPIWILKFKNIKLKNTWKEENVRTEMEKTFAKYKEFKYYCLPIIKSPSLIGEFYYVAIRIYLKIHKKAKNWRGNV